MSSAFVAIPRRESYLQWVPTDQKQLLNAEKKILEPIDGHYRKHTVKTPLCDINTISCTMPHHQENILLLHGFGFGLGQWVANWITLAQHANVHAIDMPGFGCSGRPNFEGSTDSDAILFFIQTIEEWMKVMMGDNNDNAEGEQKGDDDHDNKNATSKNPPPPHEKKWIIIGHSFGGYIAGKFAMNYPQRVSKLILVDPFGVNGAKPEECVQAHEKLLSPLQKVRNWAAETIFYKVNPLSLVRALGPFAPGVVAKRTHKHLLKFKGHLTDDRAIVDYIYHCNAQPPSGETAFSLLISGLGMGWGAGFNAKRPLMHELHRLSSDIPLYFIYGAHSWVPSNVAYDVASHRELEYKKQVMLCQLALQNEIESVKEMIKEEGAHGEEDELHNNGTAVAEQKGDEENHKMNPSCCQKEKEVEGLLTPSKAGSNLHKSSSENTIHISFSVQTSPQQDTPPCENVKLVSRADCQLKEALFGSDEVVVPSQAATSPTTKVFIVSNAGHHVYVENSARFNGILKSILCPRCLPED